jgi:hypothetical protein
LKPDIEEDVFVGPLELSELAELVRTGTSPKTC